MLTPRRGLQAAAITLLLLAPGTGASNAVEPDGVSSDTVTVSLGKTDTNSLQAESLPPGACTATVDTPHYSRGATGVIFKTRITCTRTATLELSGTLYEGPHIGPGRPVRSSLESKTVMGGIMTTWYTPLDGRVGADCHRQSHYWGSIVLKAYGGTMAATTGQKKQVRCPG